MTAALAAELLRRAVIERGRIEGSLLKVDEFLNHRVDTSLMSAIGAGLAELVGGPAPDLVLTAEASGIPPALACAGELGVPMVYAKKFVGPGDRAAFARDVASPTKGIEYRVEVTRRVLEPGETVAVVDDFLSGGRTARALGEIATEAGCTVAGFGFVIEKTFMGGRALLEEKGWRVSSLLQVASLDGGVLAFEEGHG